jgi:hypothetical protein
MADARLGSGSDNGNRIGEITVQGTLALLVFVGIFTGISGGIILALLSPWLTKQVARRGEDRLVSCRICS